MSTLESAVDGAAMSDKIDIKQEYCTRIVYVLNHTFHDLK